MKWKPLTLCAAAVSAAALTAAPAHAVDLTFDSSGNDARLVSGTTNSRNDNNGGNTATGALIGLNTGGVDNYMVYSFNGLAPLPAGESVISATVTMNVATGFTNGNHGGVADLINLGEIALPNAGWVSGTSVITGGDNMTDDGSISFLNRVQYNDDPGAPSGTTEAWKDAGGSDVGDILGASTLLGSVPGYAQGGGTPVLTFNIAPATAEDWLNNGMAGVVMYTTDDGDSRSRFNFVLDAATLNVTATPEPGSLSLLGLGGLLIARRRRA